MKRARIDDMIKGWFVGDFEPTLFRTRDVEVAVKQYRAGDSEAAHYHKIATELTVVTAGTIELNGEQYSAGDVVVIEPSEVAVFRAITDAVTTVVKIPGAADDKYLAEAAR